MHLDREVAPACDMSRHLLSDRVLGLVSDLLGLVSYSHDE